MQNNQASSFSKTVINCDYYSLMYNLIALPQNRMGKQSDHNTEGNTLD